MLIPTEVASFASLAVPGTDYWAGTAAHYYINPPGTDAGTACVWGTSSNPWGNWSPYVAGANQDASGETFIKLGWNPIYLEQATPFRNKMPDWGVKIECPDGGCNGLPCAIDPTLDQVNQMQGGSTSGAGGGSFCVVTVSKGASANFVVYSSSSDSDGDSGSGSHEYSKGGQFYQSSAAASSVPPTASLAAPSSSDSSSSIISSTTTTTTTSEHPPTTATTTTTTTQSSSSEEITFHNSTTTHQPSTTTTWLSANTTTKRTRPTGQAYYVLRNTTSTSPIADAETGAGPTGIAEAALTGPNPTASVTGGASALSMSFLAVIPITLWSLI